VHTAAEGDVRVAGTVEVDDPRVVEHGGVVVGDRQQSSDPCAVGDRAPSSVVSAMATRLTVGTGDS
jgi:hypothetical protein